MAENRVGFGHDGFEARCKMFNFSQYRGAAENVAYNMGIADPGKAAVDGWIKSPGHRKNLLGNYNFMGIGVFNANGNYFFTQIFALASL